jgi:ribosome assembly protein 1
VIAATTSKQVTIQLRVRPLPAEVTEFLSKNSRAIKRLYADRQAEEGNDAVDAETQKEEAIADDGVLGGEKVLSLEEFKQQLQAVFDGVKGQRDIWGSAIEQITAFGPRRTGPNLLIDATKDSICGRLYVALPFT